MQTTENGPIVEPSLQDADLINGFTPNKIIIVGLGEVARTHLEALSRLGQTVIAGVDIDPTKELVFGGKHLPVYRSPAEAANQHPDPDIVVVSTPTPAHHSVCKQVFSAFSDKPLRVLVEKPCADRFTDVQDLYNSSLNNVHLETLLHYAYSPEILWAYEHLESWLKEYGPIKSFRADFTGPRSGPDQAQRRETLVSSWLDLGINALSAINRLVDLKEVELHPLDAPFDYEATASFDSESSHGSGVVATKWNVKSAVHESSFTFSSGARLLLNNYLVTGHLVDGGGAVRSRFAGDGTPRRLAHYLSLYGDILGDESMAVSTTDNLKLHKLLFTRRII